MLDFSERLTVMELLNVSWLEIDDVSESDYLRAKLWLTAKSNATHRISESRQSMRKR